MDEKKKFVVLDENGKEVVCEPLFTFESDETKKQYVVYTDNVYNSNNELQIYINEYNSQNLECLVNNISDNDEYNKIKSEINSILLTMKNEVDKIDDIDIK